MDFLAGLYLFFFDISPTTTSGPGSIFLPLLGSRCTTTSLHAVVTSTCGGPLCSLAGVADLYASRRRLSLSGERSRVKAKKQDASQLILSTEEIKSRLAAKEAEVQEAKPTIDAKLVTIGNIVHESLLVSNDEANNAIVRTWGERRLEGKSKNHVDVKLS